MEAWSDGNKEKNWVLRKRFFFLPSNDAKSSRRSDEEKADATQRRSSCLPSRRHLIAADEEGGETARDEAMAILIVKARLPLDEWHFQMERQPAEHGDGLVGDQNVEANVSLFHFLGVVSPCPLSNVSVYVCKCGVGGCCVQGAGRPLHGVVPALGNAKNIAGERVDDHGCRSGSHGSAHGSSTFAVASAVVVPSAAGAGSIVGPHHGVDALLIGG